MGFEIEWDDDDDYDYDYDEETLVTVSSNDYKAGKDAGREEASLEYANFFHFSKEAWSFWPYIAGSPTTRCGAILISHIETAMESFIEWKNGWVEFDEGDSEPVTEEQVKAV